MVTEQWIPREAERTLRRLLPRVEAELAPQLEADPAGWERFTDRLRREWPRLMAHLWELYGWQYDFYYTLEQTLGALARSWAERPSDLRQLDHHREADPEWFLSQEMVGIVLYVDLFSDNLAKLGDHIAYLRQLGVTYLHLMPLFTAPHGENDGGYAVSDYRAINPDVGTMEELNDLARILRRDGISLVLDFVFNHTSDEHRWAQRAKAGDPDYLDYYLTFPDRTLPDQYQKTLRETFPTVRRGSFTFDNDLERWVWTTFNSYQWDLNYANPEVFRAMLGEMLFLANQGVDVLRLDAVAFTWKEVGTSCENLPEAHTLIRAFNAAARIACPALVFKSEAIVHPDEVLKYVDLDECQLSYNPLLMALLWEALATRDVRLLAASMRSRSRLPTGCSWVNYIRCHDDIGWTFDDDEARRLGIDPEGHRRFLNAFYSNRHTGSFARGIPFQHDDVSGDMRISGTLSSLAGLEAALEENDSALIELAVRRVNLMRSILVTAGGIPLLYAGDEWGELNDYTYLTDPTKIDDSRWVHRAKRRWEARDDLSDQDTLEWRFFREMVKLFRLRKGLPVLRDGGMEVVATGNPHLLGYRRGNGDQRLLVVSNFSEEPQTMVAADLDAAGREGPVRDLYAGVTLAAGQDLELDGYRFVWLDLSAITDVEPG